ncbi:N-acetylneuraminate synthase [uncultured Lamprocystis sp.]|jgi:N,N'-diacetyllegionaminate synthase|uniref:N-acetylneuraminate synthase n=1 Tax=uncultured Lamprocystis sp. TaxID=543132 RepID=UPI0025D579A6|nr:N-acetylneuraminate synthase [uncultured Lamprocystis sp.]
MNMARPVLIIAEAGVNHNGDLDLARRLIDVAAEAGAALVKFQTFSAERLVTVSARRADYQARNMSGDETHFEMLRRLELSIEAHQELIAHCAARGIAFFSTGFDIESVDFLAALGLDKFKIPSGEITNLPFLRNMGRYGREIILSTGMSTLGDIEAAIEALEQAGTPRSRITVLHCTTEYPTPMNEVNLRAMQSIAQAFGVRVGYSDHTPGIEVAIAAVALGASVIEKHFTLDRNLPGPDHKASLEPAELKAMVAAIRNIEMALGDGVKRLTSSEIKNRPIVRKSLVAARAITAGDVFGQDNLAVKRPGTGISPMHYDSLLGRVAVRNYSADELIEP